MQTLTVIKVGGKIVEDETTLAQLLKDFSAIPGPKVLVHGGGRSATKIAAQLGIDSTMIGGRRVSMEVWSTKISWHVCKPVASMHWD